MAQGDPVVPPIIQRNYGDRLSLDLDASLPSTMPGGCLSLKNVVRRHGRGLGKRPGVKMHLSNEPRDTTTNEILCALHNYQYSNTTYGITEELLALGGASGGYVFPPATGSISINYSGAGVGTFSCLVNSSNLWEVNLLENGVQLGGWPKTFGNGITAGAGIRISDLVTAIDAEANWTASDPATTNDRSTVAQIGSIPATVTVTASTPDLTIPYSTIGTPLGTPLVTTSYGVGVDTIPYYNLKGVNANNCMYMPYGKRPPILKYDGHAAYQPGLPRFKLYSVADAGSGATHAAGNTYIYRAAFWRIDNRGNEIWGPYSDDTITTALGLATHTVGGAPTDITVNLNPLIKTASSYYGESRNFDPRTAKVNGAQVAVSTVTVDAGHNVVAGDSLYLYNGITAAYETRAVSSVGATTVTLSGGNVTVADDDLMSNIRIQIQRTENGGIDFFEVASIPNDGRLTATAQVFIDNVSDANLGAAIEDQLKLPEPPPHANFCCIHQGLVVYANLEGDPDGFTWNDPEWGLEAYPTATNRDQVRGSTSGEITAIISESDTTLGIFKRRSYFRVQGDLAAGQYTITEVAENRLGIASHASLVKVEDGYWGISDDGPVFVQDGLISLLASEGVHDYFFDNDYKTPLVVGTAIAAVDQPKLVPARSTGAYWPEEKVIVFFVPAESGTPQANVAPTKQIGKYANSSSLWLCYDLNKKRLEWREWEFANANINAHLAMTVSGNDLYFLSTNDTPSGGPTFAAPNFVWRFLPSDSIYSFVDNADPIKWQPRLQWESLGLPSSEKKMTEVKLYMRHASDFLASFALTIREYQNDDDVTLYTQASRTFSASTDKEKIIEAIPGSFESNSIEFYNNELYQCPVLSGFEVAYRITAPPEVKDIKGDL